MSLLVAAGTRHTAVLLTNGPVTIVRDCDAAPGGLGKVLQIAAGHRFTVALKNDGKLVAWGDNASGQTHIPAGLTNIQTLACGPSRTVALPYTSVLSYPVDVRKDLLVIYNSNFTESVQMKDYYLVNRPRVANANVLGTGLYSTNSEWFNSTDYTNTFWTTVSNWYASNPTKRPAHVLLMYGVPNRADVTTNAGPVYSTLNSTQHLLRSTVPGRRPFISALNFYRTNDCKAYINKLANIGTNNALNRVVLSADKAGIYRDVYVVDNFRPTTGRLTNDTTVGSAKQALLNFGFSASSIFYRDNIATPSDTAVISATNILNHLSWGGYNGLGWDWATNGNVETLRQQLVVSRRDNRIVQRSMAADQLRTAQLRGMVLAVCLRGHYLGQDSNRSDEHGLGAIHIWSRPAPNLVAIVGDGQNCSAMHLAGATDIAAISNQSLCHASHRRPAGQKVNL